MNRDPDLTETAEMPVVSMAELVGVVTEFIVDDETAPQCMRCLRAVKQCTCPKEKEPTCSW